MGKKKGNKDRGKAEGGGAGDGKDKQEKKTLEQSAVPGPGGDTTKKHDRNTASGSGKVKEPRKEDILVLDFPSLSISNPQHEQLQKRKGSQKQQQPQREQQQQPQREQQQPQREQQQPQREQQQPQREQQQQQQQKQKKEQKQPKEQGNVWQQQQMQDSSRRESGQSTQQHDKQARQKEQKPRKEYHQQGQQQREQQQPQREQQQQQQQQKQKEEQGNVWQQDSSRRESAQSTQQHPDKQARQKEQKPKEEYHQQGQQQQMQGAWGQTLQSTQHYPEKQARQKEQKPREQYHQQEQQQQEFQGAWRRDTGQSTQQHADKQARQKEQKPREQYHKQGPQQQQQHKQQERQQQPQLSAQKDSVSSSKSSISSASASPTKSIEQFKRTDVNLARGTKGRKIKLEVNYLKLLIEKMIDTAYHYDIKFDPDKPKRFIRPAFIEYCNKVNIPQNIKLAFDGKCNVYSPFELDNKFLKCVDVTAQDHYGSKEFKVTLMKTGNTTIDLTCLKKDYRNLPIYDKPQRALQCLDVVLRSPCYDRGVLAGRAFYNSPPKRIDLTEGYELWYGLFLAAVLGEVPLLNIDICHRSFISGMPVLECLKYFENPRRNEFINFDYELHYKFQGKLDSTLRRLIVIYEPPKCFNASYKRYTVNQVMGPSEKETFLNETGQKMTVAAYYASRNFRLQYPKMPCVWVGNRDKRIYLPAELLRIEEGQVSKKTGVQQVRNMIRDAATTTTVRKEKTLREFNRFHHNSDPIINSFRIKIDSDFVQLEGRIIDAPVLNYRNGNCTPREGSWDPFRNSLTFLKQPAKPFFQSAVLNLDNYVHDRDAKNFGDSLKREGGKIGVNLDFKRCLKADLRDLDKNLVNLKSEGMDIIFVILSGRFADSYSKVKQLAETKYGLLTQCIKADTVTNKNNISTLQNILLKVNAKLNGNSHVIDKKNSTNILNSKDVMFIGADVTHPSPEQKLIPSVVGVCASHDLDGVEYNIQWRLQDPKKEIIQNMSDILEAHLKMFQKRTNTLPKKIIYYRDGVSDGQFPQIKNEELRAMDHACSKFREKSGEAYRPKVTCIIVQKRHRTRFFPKPGFEVGKFKNVPPGTIVDTYITHPNECQFFMVSHQSIQGTAKPTKYVVIRDDAKYDIDDLQALTNNLCHLFTRCNRAVSYPAPAYYAHLVAYRGRVYIENMKINLNNLEREYQMRKIIGLDQSNPMFFV